MGAREDSLTPGRRLSPGTLERGTSAWPDRLSFNGPRGKGAPLILSSLIEELSFLEGSDFEEDLYGSLRMVSLAEGGFDDDSFLLGDELTTSLIFSKICFCTGASSTGSGVAAIVAVTGKAMELAEDRSSKGDERTGVLMSGAAFADVTAPADVAVLTEDIQHTERALRRDKHRLASSRISSLSFEDEVESFDVVARGEISRSSPIPWVSSTGNTESTNSVKTTSAFRVRQ